MSLVTSSLMLLLTSPSLLPSPHGMRGREHPNQPGVTWSTLRPFTPEGQFTESHEREMTRVERWLYGHIEYILLMSVQLEA